jgi:hypothetical protein
MSATAGVAPERRNGAPLSPLHRWSTALLYALTLAGYPLVATLPIVLGMPSRAISVTFRAGYLALSIAVLAGNLKRSRIYVGVALLPLGAFWLLYTLRLASDLVFFPVAAKLPAAEYFAWAYGTCFIPMLAFLTRPDDRTLDLAAKVSVAAAILACVVALYSNYLALLSGMSDTFATGRLGTDTLNTIELGYLGAVTVLLVTFGFLRWRGLLLRGALLVAVAVALFIVGAAASRGPILALAIIGLLALGNWMRGKSLPKIAWATALAALALALALGGLTLIEERLGFRGATRLSSVQSLGSEQSGEVHLSLAADAWSEFLDHPLLGVGVDEQRSRDYPHNVLLESFMATGFVGGIAFCGVLLASMMAVVSLLSDRGGQWLALVYLLVVLAALAAGALYLSGSMWCFGAAVIAVSRDKRLREQKAHSARLRSVSAAGSTVRRD